MAQLYSTGPALIYVAITQANGQLGGQPASTAFLGTAEFAPQIHVRREFEPIFNDLGGGRVAFDTLYSGKEAFTFLDTTRWDEGIFTQIAALPRGPSGAGFNPANPSEGFDVSGDIGTIMIQEGLAYTVFVKFPYSAKPAYSSMIPGYRFPFSYLLGPDELPSIGTKPMKRHLVFHHLRGFDPIGNNFMLFDHRYLDTLPAIT